MCKEGLPRVEQFAVSRKEAMEDQMILGLRLREGVDLDRFAARFGVKAEEEFADVIADETAKGMLEQVGRHLRLTRKALPLGNEVFARFLRD
jgi:oxygen-independent coproporphyrinogen-3 oxidase